MLFLTADALTVYTNLNVTIVCSLLAGDGGTYTTEFGAKNLDVYLYATIYVVCVYIYIYVCICVCVYIYIYINSTSRNNLKLMFLFFGNVCVCVRILILRLYLTFAYCETTNHHRKYLKKKQMKIRQLKMK